jgi:tetrahydromethanopterin S-methyltransferase subunit B
MRKAIRKPTHDMPEGYVVKVKETVSKKDFEEINYAMVHLDGLIDDMLKSVDVLKRAWKTKRIDVEAHEIAIADINDGIKRRLEVLKLIDDPDYKNFKDVPKSIVASFDKVYRSYMNAFNILNIPLRYAVPKDLDGK